MAESGLFPANNSTPADSEAVGPRPSVADLLGFAAYTLAVGGSEPDFATLFTTLGRALSGQPLESAWLPVETPARPDMSSATPQPSSARLDCDTAAPAVGPDPEGDWLLVAKAARAAAASF